MESGESLRKLALHGPVVQLECDVPILKEPLDLLLSRFQVPELPDAFSPTSGTIHTYEESEVLSALPQSARHLTRTPDAIDIYEDADRYWLVDERWGMAEIDLPENSWHSWVLPQPKVDPLRLAELSVLWPMAQLLRPRGLHLLPSISAVRDGFAVLIICPFGVEPELTALINNGYKIIGQRWTALREEDDRIALLHMPGQTERTTTPRLRFGSDEQMGWTDVTQSRPGSSQSHAFCDAVLVAEPGRRGKAHLRSADPISAIDLLRREWPIVELESSRKGSSLPSKLAESCKCFEVQLSRNTNDLLALLSSVRYANPMEDGQTAVAA